MCVCVIGCENGRVAPVSRLFLCVDFTFVNFFPILFSGLNKIEVNFKITKRDPCEMQKDHALFLKILHFGDRLN